MEDNKKKKYELPPPGAYCDHSRMKAVSCGNCKGKCYYECPCGIDWEIGGDPFFSWNR